jgi:hypothetical protein
MEEVASMVGLGWNLNAGAINRNLRGLPDDFNGDEVVKDFNIKAYKSFSGKITGSGEIAAIPQVLGFTLSAGIGCTYNNYTGWGLERSLAGSASYHFSTVKGLSGDLGIGMGTAASTDRGIDTYISPSFSFDIFKNCKLLKFGAGAGATFSRNSIEGSRASLNTNMTMDMKHSNSETEFGTKDNKMGVGSAGVGVPLQPYLNNSYNPDVRFPMLTRSNSASIMAGYDVWLIDPGLKIEGSETYQSLANKQLRLPAFGSIYERGGAPQNGGLPDNALMDFSREKTLPYFANQSKILPVPFKMPDIFNLQAQGLAMTFSLT